MLRIITILLFLYQISAAAKKTQFMREPPGRNKLQLKFEKEQHEYLTETVNEKRDKSTKHTLFNRS